MRNPFWRRDERGIALIMVIWVLALLSLMAASFLSEARVEVRRAGNLIARAKAEALAEGGIQLAIARLVKDGAAGPQHWTEAVADGSIALTVSDERGKIDLNEAPARMLAGLFRAQGIEPQAVDALAAAVVDFRDADHDAGLNGAEDPAYDPGSGGAKDARLQSLTELLDVKGMTRKLYLQLAPYLTVQTGRGQIDPQRAERPVLEAVPGIDRHELDRYLALRTKLLPIISAPLAVEGPEREARAAKAAEAQAQLAAALPQRNDVAQYFTPAEPTLPTLTIAAEAEVESGARFRQEAVIRIVEDPQQPFLILEWRRSPEAD